MNYIPSRFQIESGRSDSIMSGVLDLMVLGGVAEGGKVNLGIQGRLV